jgi:uncharacterized membrane protein required for colicin V production
MNLIDLFIFLAVLLAGVLGYRDGFFRKIFGTLGFLVGLVVATTYMGALGRRLTDWFSFSIEISYILAFFVLFLSVIVLQNVLFRLVGKKEGKMKIPTRIGGAFLGMAQGLLAASLLLLMLSVIDLPTESARRSSVSYKAVLNIAPRVFDYWLLLSPQSKAFHNELKKDLRKYETFD